MENYQQQTNRSSSTINTNNLTFPNHNNLSTTSSSNSYRSEIDSDAAIRKALVGLSPDTRQSLLTILLATQPNHHQSPQPGPSNHHQQQIYQQLDLDQHLQSPTNYQPNHSWNHLNFLSNQNHHQQQQQQQQQPLHSELTSPMLSDKQPFHSNLTETIPHQTTPVLSPSMTPLSTFSTSSYPNSATISDTLSSHSSLHPPFQASNPQLELFSPLTSPALRPLGYHEINQTEINHPHTIPATINQAPSLARSAHQSFIPGDGIISTRTPSQSNHHQKPPPQLSSQTHLNQPSSTIFPSQSNFITHPNSLTMIDQVQPTNDICHNEYINQSPILHPHHSSSTTINLPTTPSTSSTKLSGRQRSSRNSNNRPSPLIRPLDKAIESCEDRTSSAKRARSLTGVSISMSPSFASGLANMGLADSPSPVDMQSRELKSISSSSSSALENPTTTPGRSRTFPDMPPPQGLSSIPSNPNGWRLQPLTPASLFNFENSLVVEPSMCKPQDNSQGAENGSCRTWESAKGTSEYGQGSQNINHSLKDREFTESVIKCIQAEQPSKSTGSSRSGSKEKTSPNGLNSARIKTKENNPKGKKNGTNKVRLDLMTTMENEEEGPEHRKSSHKVAEQRRRDSLKMCFEDLRLILPPIQWNERKEGQAQEKRPGEGNVGGQRTMNAFDPLNPNKGISKVALLRRSNEYILRLKERLKRRDGAIEMLMQMLVGHRLASLSDQSNGSQKTQEAKEVGPSGCTPNRPHSIQDQLKVQDPLQILEDSFNHDQNQEMLGELRKILVKIRMEKQEDKDDHRLNHPNHTDQSWGSGDELD